MPPISRFGGGGRAKKKQSVIDKLKTFFEKYFGIGGSSAFTKPENKRAIYDLSDSKYCTLVGRKRKFPLPAVLNDKLPAADRFHL